MRHTDRDRRGWREDNRKQDYQSMKGIDTDPHMPVSKNEAGGRFINGARGHSDPRPVVSHPVARRQNRIQPVGTKPVPPGAVAETPMRQGFPLRK